MARDTDARDIDTVWGSTAGDGSENTVFTTTAQQQAGWGPEYAQTGSEDHPEREVFNWHFKRLSAYAKEGNEHGAGREWDASITYITPAYVFGSDGLLYFSTNKTLDENIPSTNPTTDGQTAWKAFNSDVADGAVGTDQLAADAVTEAKIADNSVQVEHLLTTSDGSNGQLLSRTSAGMNWINAPDTGITGVTAGTGLSGGGTSGSVTLNIESGGVDTTQLADDAVTRAKINASGGANGRYLEYHSGGLRWSTVSSGSGTLTGIDAGTGIRVDDSSSSSPEINISNGGVDTTQLANNAVTLAKLSPSTGSNNQYLQRTSSGLRWNTVTSYSNNQLVPTGGSNNQFLRIDGTTPQWETVTLAPSNAESNVQADWNQSSSSHDGYVRNKPTIPNITIDDDAPDASDGSNGDIWLEY